MTNVIVAYVPVVHAGYLAFFAQFPEASIVIMGKDLTDRFRPLQKDIRALEPAQIERSLQALFPKRQVKVGSAAELTDLANAGAEMIMPDEEVSRAVAQEYFANREVTFAPVFLRWDREKSTADQTIEAHDVISHDHLDQELMQRARDLKEKSADWWRQIGAVVVKDGQIIGQAYNRHVPDEQQPYLDGDPRADFHRGEDIDKSTALHAEAGLIAEAAKNGTSLAGASLYVTTFPCPNCAKLVAYSGIKKLFFEEGYAMLDGQRILTDMGVEIIRVLDR